ncbi:hypothetical protein TL16_g01109 [Triparma laevis f. inornata]|uniref:PDZ GRASP-type domain-containing protein n=1 Tax=Triparma laevis f. inornata TaxID=1714386 RepID=A0A9W7DQV3_9STRA|nr:hypothetical protein TL16_g01109 [Triparma laevis f. inornata]
MGANESTEKDPEQIYFGYRILNVAPSSPSSSSTLCSYFDFIFSLSTPSLPFQPLNNPSTNFNKIIKTAYSNNETVTFKVFNLKNRKQRIVTIKPSKWEGLGLLGITLRPDTYYDDLPNSIKILSLEENGAADKAGLEGGEWILGTEEKGVKGVEDFGRMFSSFCYDSDWRRRVGDGGWRGIFARVGGRG